MPTQDPKAKAARKPSEKASGSNGGDPDGNGAGAHPAGGSDPAGGADPAGAPGSAGDLPVPAGAIKLGVRIEPAGCDFVLYTTPPATLWLHGGAHSNKKISPKTPLLQIRQGKVEKTQAGVPFAFAGNPKKIKVFLARSDGTLGSLVTLAEVIQSTQARSNEQRLNTSESRMHHHQTRQCFRFVFEMFFRLHFCLMSLFALFETCILETFAPCLSCFYARRRKA